MPNAIADFMKRARKITSDGIERGFYVGVEYERDLQSERVCGNCKHYRPTLTTLHARHQPSPHCGVASIGLRYLDSEEKPFGCNRFEAKD